MSKGSISKKKNPTPDKGIRKNEKEEEDFKVRWQLYWNDLFLMTGP
jgi:hypothetical protein